MSIMEDKSGTTSSQAQGVVGSDTLIDRFSALPNEVVLHIMSSIEMKDLIRLRCVSKKIKKLTVSVPTLNIDGSSSIYKKSKKRLNLLNHLDRFLMQRKGCKIGRLRIAWSFNSANTSEEQFRIATWIYTAVSCNIEELELVFSIDCGLTFELPYDLLGCSTLRTLKVDLSNKTLRLPALAIPSNLQQLHLKNVIVSEEVWRWISSLHITELRLELVNGVGSVTVEIPSLKKFHLEFVRSNQNRLSKLLIVGAKLEDIDVRGPFNHRGLDSLKIVAPNLRRLKLLGYLMNQLCLGRFTCLEKAELFLSPKVDDNGKLFEVFSSIRKTKVLHLDDKTIEVLRDGPVQLPLHDISCFRAYLFRLTDDIVPSVVHLLRGMLNLNTLFIATTPSMVYELFPYYFWFYGGLGPYDEVKENAPASGCNQSYWNSQNLACIDQLKEVRLELSKGTNELELACYILENAKNLKKMVIIHTYHQSPAVRMINACNLRSCDARVLFYRRKKPTLKDLYAMSAVKDLYV